jgi:hypothetical protein
MSLEDQKKRLEEMSKNASPSNEFNQLRIIVPENKTSSEKLYGSPELKMLAPTENISPDENKTEEGSDKKDETDTSNKTNDKNTKTISF